MSQMIQTASKLTVEELKTAYINIYTRIAELPDHYSAVLDAMLDALMAKLPEAEFCKFCAYCDAIV